MKKKEKTRKATLVDPPSGWRYGFPCELPEGMTLEELLKKKNYPEKDIELALKYSRWWTDDVPVKK